MVLYVVASLVAAFLAFAAIGALFGDDDDDGPDGATERSDPADVGIQGSLSVFDVVEGDCLELPAGTASTEVLRVDKVDCGVAHDLEIYALVVHPGAAGDPFPGLDAIVGFADNECVARFEGFVGSSYEASEFDVFYLYPQEQSWSFGDREVVCGVSTVDGSPITGSVEGSGR